MQTMSAAPPEVALAAVHAAVLLHIPLLVLVTHVLTCTAND